jgi:signal peptidase
MPRTITLVRRVILAAWVGLVVLVMALVAGSHVAPALGYTLVIVKGPSMEPAIPLGSLAIERPAIPADLAVGQVVTFVLPNHVVVTHRITRLGDANGTLLIETKGDANAAPDPAMHPASGVTGIVVAHVPVAGFLLAFLAVPLGMLSVISMLGSLLLAVWLLQEFDAHDEAENLDPVGVPLGHELGGEPAT